MIQCEMIQTGGRLHIFGERGILGLFGAQHAYQKQGVWKKPCVPGTQFVEVTL